MTLSDTDILVEREREPRPERIGDALSAAVGDVLFGANGYASVQGLVRVVVPLHHRQPLRWLAAQDAGPRFYWRGRGAGAPEIASLGTADEIRCDGLDGLERLYRQRGALLGTAADHARYFGGCAFDFQAPQGPDWESFPPVWFFLPRFEFHTTPSGARLVCNLVLPRDRGRASEIIDLVRSLREPVEFDDVGLPVPVSRQDVPQQAEWLRAVERTLVLLGGESLGKVVMARKAQFGFREPVDAFALLSRLASVTPACFHFLLEIDRGVSLMGASPERLYRRKGRSIESEAVAGTRPRGVSAVDDERLREELLLSKKDRLEHAFVETSIREVLERLCEDVQVDADASEMTLARGRHLVSGIRGKLHDAVTDLDVLRGLHPTPAVGGHPTAQALRAIREMEPFGRGWYAGPVGWMSRESSEFAVAIRTGLVTADTLTLFSGAGIVPGSEAQAEWDEIEHKIGDFTNVLGLDLERPKY